MAAFDRGMMCRVERLRLYKIAHSREIQHCRSPLLLSGLRDGNAPRRARTHWPCVNAPPRILADGAMAPRRVGQREKGRNGQHRASDQCDKHIVLHGHLLEVDSAIGYRVRKKLGAVSKWSASTSPTPHNSRSPGSR